MYFALFDRYEQMGQKKLKPAYLRSISTERGIRPGTSKSYVECAVAFMDQNSKETKMNRFDGVIDGTAGNQMDPVPEENSVSGYNPLMWLMLLLLAAIVAGCGGHSSNPAVVLPAVSYTVPDANATGVATNRKITATFSKDMAPATISAANFTLAASGAAAVTGTVAYDVASRTATFTPTNPAPLATMTVYNATITTAATDMAGHAMAAAKTWSFTTGAGTDTTAPTVSSTVPLDAASGVALNTTVSAAFSEAMDPATINATNFSLAESSVAATPVTGVVTNVGTNAIFTPSSNLAASTPYKATVTTAVTDLAGNHLAAPKIWSFTTGTTVAAGPAPVILGTAANYAILAKTGVATVPTSHVTGNVGVSPVAATYLTGWSQTDVGTPITHSTSTQVVGQLYAADYTGGTTSADLTTAVLNMQAAFTDAAGRTATSAATTNVGAGTLTSLTLVPGVYEWGSNVTIPTNLTLSGAATDVWIFKVAGTLDMAAAKSVILAGAASAKNIFWQVSGAVTIGTGTHFEGIILGQTSITMGTGSSINGRLLAQTAVNLDATTVTQPAP